MTSDREANEQMNILFVSATVPYPAIDGGRIRVLNLVSRLCRIHKVVFLTFATAPHDQQGIEHLRGMGIEVIGVRASCIESPVGAALRSFIRRRPLTVAKYCSAEMIGTLKNLLKERRFDIVHFEMLHTGQFLADLKSGNGDICSTVLGEQNIDSRVWYRLFKAEPNPLKKLIFYWQYKKFTNFEIRTCPQFDLCICVSEQDQEDLNSLCPGIATAIVPNGVDLDYFSPVDGKEDEESLVFTGSMDWHPNEDAVLYFCNQIFPIIRSRLPAAKFTVVGSNPSDRVLRLKDLEGVDVTGSVEDVRPYISDAAVYVVPLRIGGGTRLKILQALAMKKAIVSTAIGCEGLDLEPGKNLLVSDKPQDFAASVIQLIEDKGLQKKLGEDGNMRIRERYSWDVIIQRLEAAYKSLVANAS